MISLARCSEFLKVSQYIFVAKLNIKNGLKGCEQTSDEIKIFHFFIHTSKLRLS